MKYQSTLVPGLLLACTLAAHADMIINPPLKESPMTVKMNIDDQQFEVKLNDNPAAKAFVNTLPLQLGMEELNGNEIFADLPYKLPSSPVWPGTIQAGDLMLYGTQTLVLFYTSFESSYRYTPIGKVIHPENLPTVVDKKTIGVRFNDH
ncbi:cyclophilin-like fold protein [Serratia fonticola]|uniref:cyclophilin-like fold protein n=1 Tax=Serratia fonticola TaxID=47917 RepID=UPI00301C7086